MKKNLPLLIVVVAVLAGLFYLSSTATKAPFIPRDALHSASLTQEGCLACHAPGKQAPLKENHPPKEQCLVCHKSGGK